MLAGPPQVNTSAITVRTKNENGDAQMMVPFCANPAVDPEKSYWDVGGTHVKFGATAMGERYRAYQPVTVSYCIYLTKSVRRGGGGGGARGVVHALTPPPPPRSSTFAVKEAFWSPLGLLSSCCVGSP